MISEFIRIISNIFILIDFFIMNNRESIVYFGVYFLFISDYNFIFVICKIGILNCSLRYVEI